MFVPTERDGRPLSEVRAAAAAAAAAAAPREEMDEEETHNDNIHNINNEQEGEEEQENPNPNPNPNPPSDDVSESESESEEEEKEEEEKFQVERLESELYNNPSNYDAHVEYIKVLRKMGDIQKLRQAREAMSSIFPLTPTMWQDWARDEASLNNITGPEGYSIIEKLYERGVSDYLSVPLWLDYINFMQENDPSVRECSHAGITKARNLFERAVTAAGLHIAQGSLIWETYREFEQALLYTIPESDTQAKEKQIERIRTIFHRQLSIPLVNSEDTLQAYKAWEVEQGSYADLESCDVDKLFPHVASAYRKALDMYKVRAQFEEQISRKDLSDEERVKQYQIYLKYEQSSGDPARVQILYERAVKDFPVWSDLWLDYTCYLDKTLKVGKVVKDVHLRATKNCPWVGQLWVGYLLCLERARSSEEEMSTVFERSMGCSFSTFEEYRDLFLTRIDGLRRRISSCEVEDPSDFLSIRETFQHASDYLSPHLKNTDSMLRLHAYWARLEVKLGKDMNAARGVWENVLKTCGSMIEAWQGYISMEIELGHLSEARAIYKRCYSKRFLGKGSEEICYSWLRFEGEFGTLEDFDQAWQKVSPRLEELRLFALQQEHGSKGVGERTATKSVHGKRKSVANLVDEESPAKRQKDSVEKPKKARKKEKSQLQIETNSDKVQESKEVTDKASGADEQEKKPTSDKVRSYTDQCTVFIANLDLKANYNHLKDFFNDVGGVTAIRILHDKFTGKSRGLAYVDFVDDEHLAAAVAKNKSMLLGKRLSIARSDPKKAKKESTHNGGSGRQDAAGRSKSTESVETSRGSGTSHKPQSAPRKQGGDTIQLKGKNTFARPRAVMALGSTANKPRTDTDEDDKPKSNDEFRQMLLKK